MKYYFRQTIFIFIISFLIHNIYTWLPSFVTSIFFPVNESIWEHIKMIFTSYMIIMLIQKKSIISYIITSILNIIVFLIIYLPIYIVFGENLIITLIIYFVSIFISSILFKFLLERKKHLNKLNVLSIILILFIYIGFGFLTYYPINYNLLFFDYSKNIYGIPK
jgi:hypothetical protein